MDTRNIIRNSFSVMRQTKLRTGLTMLSIIIGISSVIVVSSVGKGQIVLIKRLNEELTENVFVLNVYKYCKNYRVTPRTVLTLKEIYELAKNPNIAGISPWYSLSTRDLIFLDNKKVSARSAKNMTYFGGVCSGYLKARNYNLLYGKTFSEGDKRNFVIIDAQLALKLYNTKNAVGKSFKLLYGNDDIIKLNVIGVIENPFFLPSKMKNSSYATYIVLLSFEYLQSLANPSIEDIFVKFKNKTNRRIALQGLLNSISKMKNIPEGVYRAEPVSGYYLGTKNTINRLNTYLISIAMVILLVGGIGIMLIMLLIINERKEEIGLRKALGAKNRDILLQFLMEAVILSLTGGIIGILIGLAGCFIAGEICYIPPVINWNMLIISLLLCVFIGIIFGVYPAYKAAKLDPIDTLRKMKQFCIEKNKSKTD